MQVAVVLLYITAIATALGCTTTAEKNLDLPVVAAKTPEDKAINDAMTLSAHAIMNWQSYFMPPPNQTQRQVIAQKLASWADLDSADALLKKARAEIAIGREPAAEASLRTAIRLDARHQEALLELAQLYIRKRDMTRAFELITQLRDTMQNQPRVDPSLRFRYRYALALAYIGRGDRQQGHEILSDLIGIDPSFPPAYTAMAASYVSQGRWDAAEFIAKRGLDRGQEDASLLNLLGAVAARNGTNKQARDYFNRAIAMAPTHAPALVNRGNLAAELGELQSAELDLQAAITAAPSYAPAHVAMGVILRKTGRYKSAADALNRAIDIDPENSLARYNLAVLYAQHLGQPNTALRLFHEVLQIKDQAGEIRELARLHIEDLKDNQNQTSDYNDAP